MLLLPGLHVDNNTHARFEPTEPRIPASSQIDQSHHPTSPSLPVPGTSLSLPSPFHFRLHIITRLSFNEQGKVTHHRDFWDLKDVMGLVPGVSLFQWIGTRMAARALTSAARFWNRERDPDTDFHDVERAIPPAEAYAASTKQTLGL